jgi:hypothetical protein
MAVTSAGLVFSGELQLAFLNHLTKKASIGAADLPGKMKMILLTRPATLLLLAMAIFYLWIYVRRAGVGDAPKRNSDILESGGPSLRSV